MFCALGLIFDDTEGVGSGFDILRSRTRFRRYRWRRLPLSFFAPGLIFGGTEGALTHFLAVRRA
jgi:hypothetical protein